MGTLDLKNIRMTRINLQQTLIVKIANRKWFQASMI